MQATQGAVAEEPISAPIGKKNAAGEAALEKDITLNSKEGICISRVVYILVKVLR